MPTASSEARHVVLAAGYDSPALAAPLGLELPIVKEQRFLFLSQPVHERLLEPLLVSAERRFAAKQLANGRVLASDLTATGDPEREREPLASDGARGHRGAHADPLLRSLRPPDRRLLRRHTRPREILGPVAGFPGLWLATGFSGHGFMMAPAVGRALAPGSRARTRARPAASFVSSASSAAACATRRRSSRGERDVVGAAAADRQRPRLRAPSSRSERRASRSSSARCGS